MLSTDLASIIARGLETSSEPQVYVSYQHADDGEIIGYVPKDLVIRASGSPSALLPAVRGIVGRADPEIPISDVRSLTEIVRAETAPRRERGRVHRALPRPSSFPRSLTSPGSAIWASSTARIWFAKGRAGWCSSISTPLTSG